MLRSDGKRGESEPSREVWKLSASLYAPAVKLTVLLLLQQPLTGAT